MDKERHDKVIKQLNKRKIFKEVRNGWRMKVFLLPIVTILCVVGIVIVVLNSDVIDKVGAKFQALIVFGAMGIYGIIWLIRRSINR